MILKENVIRTVTPLGIMHRAPSGQPYSQYTQTVNNASHFFGQLYVCKIPTNQITSGVFPYNTDLKFIGIFQKQFLRPAEFPIKKFTIGGKY